MAFFGIRNRNSFLRPATCIWRSIRARRWPSVATIVTLSGFKSRSAPFSVYRDSSLEMAKIVFWIIVVKTPQGIVTMALGTSGKLGKLSLAIPTSLNDERSQLSWTQWFSRTLNLTSASGSERTISSSLLAGTVPDPSFFTFAEQPQRTPSSRSVALMRNVESETSRRRLERIGIVVFFWTTPWVRFSSLRSADLAAANSIYLVYYNS